MLTEEQYEIHVLRLQKLIRDMALEPGDAVSPDRQWQKLAGIRKFDEGVRELAEECKRKNGVMQSHLSASDEAFVSAIIAGIKAHE